MVNDNCKCPYYCKNHGNCEQCQTDKCNGSKNTYCGKVRQIKEEPKKEHIAIKKEVVKESIWATDEERFMPEPVLVRTIDIIGNRNGLYIQPDGYLRRREEYEEICHVCGGNRKITEPEENRIIRCWNCKGMGKATDTRFTDYGKFNILFNENGRLLVCKNGLGNFENCNIYDVENGNLLKIFHTKGELINYSEGRIYNSYNELIGGEFGILTYFVGYNDEKTGEHKILNEINSYNNIEDEISKIKSKETKYNNYNFSFTQNCIYINTKNKKRLFEVPIESNSKIECIDYCPNAKLFAACLKNGIILIWRWDCDSHKTNKKIYASSYAKTEFARIEQNEIERKEVQKRKSDFQWESMQLSNNIKSAISILLPLSFFILLIVGLFKACFC